MTTGEVAVDGPYPPKVEKLVGDLSLRNVERHPMLWTLATKCYRTMQLLMNDDPRALALRWFDEIWNQRRAETIDEMWAEGGRAQIEGQDGEITREEFRQHHARALRWRYFS